MRKKLWGITVFSIFQLYHAQAMLDYAFSSRSEESASHIERTHKQNLKSSFSKRKGLSEGRGKIPFSEVNEEKNDILVFSLIYFITIT